MKKRLLFSFYFLSAAFLPDLSAQVTDTAIQKIWMHGGSAVKQYGVYGTTGVPHPDNTPGSRTSMSRWTDNEGNFWVFGGGNVSAASGGEGFGNDLWKYSPATNEWMHVAGPATINGKAVYGSKGVSSSGNIPGSRQPAATWVDADGNLWLFGGYGYGTTTTVARLNDMWKYDVAKKEWVWMHGTNLINQTGVSGTKGVSDPNNVPGCRNACAFWKDSKGKFWLFGGYGYTVPSVSSAAGTLADLWMYDPVKNEWTFVGGDQSVNFTGNYTAGSSLPGGRYCTDGWLDKSDNFWMFGGAGMGASSQTTAIDCRNDLWKYDPAANEWTFVKGGDTLLGTGVYGQRGVPNSSNVPGARYNMGCWIDVNGRFWLYGGLSKHGGNAHYFSDMWRYDPVTNEWMCAGGNDQLNVAANYNLPKGVPHADNLIGGKATMATFVDTAGNFWMFGGQKTTGATTSGRLNDLWLLQPAPPALPGQPGMFTSARKEVCRGDTGIVYSIPSVAGALSYEWIYDGGTGVTFGAGTTTADTLNRLSFSALSSSGTLRVRATNTGGNGPWRDTVITVHELPVVTVTNTGTQSICSGDSLELTAGGSSGVTYEWKRNGVRIGTNATYYANATGDYTLTVTNGNNCSATSAPATNLTVNPLPVVSVTAGGPTEICTGDTVILTATQLSGTDYQWKNGSTNTGTNTNTCTAGATGSYKVVATVTATGCADSTRPLDVSVYNRPSANLEPGDTAFCAGGLVTLKVVSADTGLTYIWKSGSVVIPLANAYFLDITGTGNYTVEVGLASVAGCDTVTNEVKVTVNPLPVADVTWDGETLHATPGYRSYQWYNNGQGIPGATDSTYKPETNSGYSVSVTDENECSSTSPVYNVTNVKTVVSGVPSVADMVRIYPNPVRDVIYIRSPVSVHASLYGMDGRLLLQADILNGALNAADLSGGVYLLRITDVNTGAVLRNERVVKP